MALIEAQDIHDVAIEVLKLEGLRTSEAKTIMEIIDYAVTKAKVIDAVPVVRCRECQHCTDSTRGRQTVRCGMFSAFMEPEDFCSYGKVVEEG